MTTTTTTTITTTPSKSESMEKPMTAEFSLNSSILTWTNDHDNSGLKNLTTLAMTAEIDKQMQRFSKPGHFRKNHFKPGPSITNHLKSL